MFFLHCDFATLSWRGVPRFSCLGSGCAYGFQVDVMWALKLGHKKQYIFLLVWNACSYSPAVGCEKSPAVCGKTHMEKNPGPRPCLQQKSELSISTYLPALWMGHFEKHSYSPPHPRREATPADARRAELKLPCQALPKTGFMSKLMRDPSPNKYYL